LQYKSGPVICIAKIYTGKAYCFYIEPYEIMIKAKERECQACPTGSFRRRLKIHLDLICYKKLFKNDLFEYQLWFLWHLPRLTTIENFIGGRAGLRCTR
jgi:hypothetical protein